MGAKIKIDFTGVHKKVNNKRERINHAVGQQVLKDSNYYAPQDTSALINSSIIASNISEGIIAWDTPYARKLYWNPQYDFSKDKNPNAQGKWFEVAKSMFLSDWINLAQKEANK